MKKINLIFFGISLFVLFSLSFSLVLACDEAEMQTMMTGNVIGDDTSNIISNNNFLGTLSLIKELLIIIVLILLVILLVKQINKKWKK